jgi:hypothetical protein
MDTSQDFSGAGAVLAALTEDVPSAARIPPIRPARSWQWLSNGRDELDLFVKDVRAFGGRSIDNRLVALGCGAELHRVVVELAAAGWTAAVTRRPHRAFPFHLATMRLAPSAPVRDPAPHGGQPFVATSPGRPGDSPRPVGPDTLQIWSSAVERADSKLFVLSDAEAYDLVTVTRFADGADDHEASTRRPLPVEEPILPELDTTFAVLYGPDDRLRTWLRAGEAFAAGCLATANHGVSIRPLTHAIEHAGTRENIRRLLPGPGCPYLIMQVGPPQHRAGSVASG